MNRLSNFILGFKFSLSYFTILPVKIKNSDDLSKKSVLAGTLFSFPLIGLIIGFITITLFGFLEHLSWFAAIFCAVIYMILYGFIHTEAIIDVADAIYAKHSGKDAYSVIKEPSVGAMGVLYAFAFVILKVSAIVYLFLNNYLYEFLVIVILSRLMVLFMIKRFTFKSSFVNALKNSFSLKYFISTVLVFSIFNFYLIGTQVIFLTILAFLFTIIIAKFIQKNLGFLNGDALGTTLETLEIFLIVSFLLLV